MPLTLYLDQSDLSYLAIEGGGRRDAERLHLEALARRGDVRLRVSFAHLAEIVRVKRVRRELFTAYLRKLPGTVHACAAPDEICAAEATGAPVDLDDQPLTAIGARRTLVAAFRAGTFEQYARLIAQSDGKVRDILNGFMRAHGTRRLKRPGVRITTGPATTLRATLRDAVQWNLDRATKVGDTFDEVHLTYACYSDIATVDKHVFEVTRSARANVASSTAWFKADSLREVLEHIERRLRT